MPKPSYYFSNLYNATSEHEVYDSVEFCVGFLRSYGYLSKLPERYRNLTGNSREAIEVWYRRLRDDAEAEPHNIRLSELREIYRNAIAALKSIAIGRDAKSST